MKKIEAIIRKTKFEEVKEALLASDINWFEYHDVHGIGQSRQDRIYRGVVTVQISLSVWQLQLFAVMFVLKKQSM